MRGVKSKASGRRIRLFRKISARKVQRVIRSYFSDFFIFTVIIEIQIRAPNSKDDSPKKKKIASCHLITECAC